MSYATRVYRQRNPQIQDEKQRPFFSKQNDVNKSNQKGAFFQAKLAVNKPGDQHEQEADSVANAVVNKSSQTPILQQKKISSIHRLATPGEDEKLGTNDARMARDKEIQEKPMPPKGGDEEKEKLKGVQKKDAPPKEEDKLKGVQRMSTGPEKEKKEGIQKKDDPKKEEEKMKGIQKKDDPKKEEEKMKGIQKKDDPKKEEEKMKGVQKKDDPKKEEEKMKGIQKKDDPKKEEEKMKGIQKKDDPKKEEEKMTASSHVQKKPEGASTTTSPQLASRIESSAGKGNNLPAKTLREMNASFGADLSNVRIHKDSEAASMNEELNAQAFTHGNDIYFDQGKYNPENSEGKFLLAHELTHTLQQNKKIQRQEDGDSDSSGGIQTADCSGYRNDHESLSYAAARHYLRTQLGLNMFPSDLICFGRSCTVFFPEDIQINVNLGGDIDPCPFGGEISVEQVRPTVGESCCYSMNCPGDGSINFGGCQ